MNETYLKTVFQALAEKIDRLEAEVYVKNLQKEERDKVIEELKKDNERLMEENEKLTRTANNIARAFMPEAMTDE